MRKERSKKATEFYIKADAIMNRTAWHRSWFGKIFYPSKLRSYFVVLRKLEYYATPPIKCNPLFYLIYLYYKIRYDRLGYQLGFEIPLWSIGYGCRVPHSGSIVLNGATKIGNYCCLMNLTTFADGNLKEIGDECYIATSVVVAKKVKIADGCKISASSFVNKDCLEENMLIGGVPAKIIKKTTPWTNECREDVEEYERLRLEMGLPKDI